LPVSVSALTRGATAARASIKELGGLSFIGHLYLISLPAALVCLRLRGKGIRAVTIVTFVAAFLVAFSTAERLGLIECLVAFVIFMGLYQPRLLRVWVVTLVSTLAIVFLILNLLWRTLPSLPPAMVDQAYPLLPKIAAGTFLTYYTDTMNKLYFDIFTKYYDTSLEDKFFMKTPDSFLARFQSKFGETRALGNAYVPAQGNYVSLDFLHGRNIMMTNPGGPAEDFLDFGWMMFLMAFAKYFLFGRIYVGARNFAPLSVALYPVFFLSALDYPRVNHLYEVRGAMAVLTACVLIPLAIVLNKRLRQAGEPALRPAYWFAARNAWSQLRDITIDDEEDSKNLYCQRPSLRGDRS
jgi:hypothetical protein